MLTCSIGLFFDALSECIFNWDENYDCDDSLYWKVLAFCKSHQSEAGGLNVTSDDLSFLSSDEVAKIVSYIKKHLSEDYVDPFELHLLIERSSL